MAHTISALKAWKKSEKRRLRNHSIKSALRTQMKKVLAAVEKKDAAGARAQLSTAYRLLDRAVVKGVVHRNNADRHKARLAARVNALGPATPAAK
ncbi:MAG TPA: 30S ribosomal protein S20 [Planctomycetota bacterium]|nr:30S ribosomal protein S20 [Planctomycetota bacterium]